MQLVPLFAITTAVISIELIRNKDQTWRRLTKTGMGVLILAGVFAAAFNYFQWNAIAAAPNIGYVNVINFSSITAVTIASALLFKDQLTIRKMTGIAITTAGLALLILTY